MQPVLISCQWHQNSAIAPRIENAVVVAGAYPQAHIRCIQQCWVLDYEFNNFGKTGIGIDTIQWHERLPHTAHLYPPNTAYWEDSRMETGTRHSGWIHFQGGNIAGLDKLIYSSLGCARFSDAGGVLGTTLTNLAKKGNDLGEAGFWRAQEDLCKIIDLLLLAEHVEHEQYRIRSNQEKPIQSSFVNGVLQFIQKHLCDKLSLEQIAREMQISVSSLSHRYHDEAGETVMTTLTRLRIERTKLLLVKGTPLKTIADLLGFSDAFHLSRTFKQVEGVSPSAFRG